MRALGRYDLLASVWNDGLALLTSGAGTPSFLLGLSKTSRALSGSSARAGTDAIVKTESTIHTSSVVGKLLNIPFLPARNVGFCINIYTGYLSRKKYYCFSIICVYLLESNRSAFLIYRYHCIIYQSTSHRKIVWVINFSPKIISPLTPIDKWSNAYPPDKAGDY